MTARLRLALAIAWCLAYSFLFETMRLAYFVWLVLLINTGGTRDGFNREERRQLNL
jgi:hypothetical protein